MEVKLISLTKPMVEEAPDMTAEELIVYTARVSNPSNQLNTATADRLIAFLIRNKHWSPFEQADMGVKVVTSRAIAAQILRHWSMSFQEFSQRYAEAVEMEPIQLRKQATHNRQSSTEEFNPTVQTFKNWKGDAENLVSLHLETSVDIYKSLLGAGVAKECARMVLPLTTQTTLYMKGNVRDWIHYLSQRTDPHAQLEHRLIAIEIEKIFAQHFPNIFKAIHDNKYDKALIKDVAEHILSYGDMASAYSSDELVDRFIDEKNME
jgi:thymidylate synthase (FAD)